MYFINSRRVRLSILLAVAAASAVAVAFLEPIAQPSGYHVFADRRRIWGVPNFWDVVSSLPFLAVGLAGTIQLLGPWPRGALLSLRPAYLFFFISMIFAAFGSAYYHLAPTHDTLVWDRLPMAVAFMAFFAVIVGEHISARLGRLLLWPLLAFGLVSVAYWHVTEEAGRGDLRLYIIVQYLPMALIPLILLLFPSAFSHVRWIWALLGAYGVAKLLELADEPVFSALHVVSGHTLKHLVAALGVYLFLHALRRRHPLFLSHT
ncbi:MAG: ceramidase domain-containing protein [Betaproteobacteria bacterium]|nr:ceramidase domain-containing protein [Betaproteobacteria bacterium]MBI2289834.1 ceramidase domain-containing protein [Betaproteobacteria bacterium]MBI3053754.1 ceramidase domain-containing protein [Betaproteobacteria bacterium]